MSNCIDNIKTYREKTAGTSASTSNQTKIPLEVKQAVDGISMLGERKGNVKVSPDGGVSCVNTADLSVDKENIVCPR